MIVKPKDATAAPPVGRRIAVDQIDLLTDRRPIDESNRERLVESIQLFGLLQPVGVSQVGDRYLLGFGNHRLAAVKQLGFIEIDALVWAEGTTPQQMLLFSLQENNLRKAESLEDTLQRVTALAQFHRCNFTEAAELAGISPASFSKIRTTVDKLCPAALQVARENKIGMAVAYEVARRAKAPDEQINWLKEHAAGRMPREAIVKASRGNQAQATKQIQLKLTLDAVSFQLSFPRTVSYEQLFEAIGKLKSGLQVHAKQNLPVHLIAEVMA